MLDLYMVSKYSNNSSQRKKSAKKRNHFWIWSPNGKLKDYVHRRKTEV